MQTVHVGHTVAYMSGIRRREWSRSAIHKVVAKGRPIPP